MNTATEAALKVIGVLGLMLSVLSGMMVFGGAISPTTHNWLMVLGMAMWFCTAIFWIQAKPLGD
ncbi:hypothetical protein KOR34_49480 [Posidoniimonas corsicana]|uniref:Uncharacterized protein n=1 Tax=Posidoniimonas corsicana TaxID=1938618 RepID=A0A5C5UX70_9BACT|nr:hypothetical protein [Posidoniimonas corsicana]TWT30389.1 hypothetical protein KOR34_49480 [Posidoniimonas corsicana]